MPGPNLLLETADRSFLNGRSPLEHCCLWIDGRHRRSFRARPPNPGFQNGHHEGPSLKRRVMQNDVGAKQLVIQVLVVPGIFCQDLAPVGNERWLF